MAQIFEDNSYSIGRTPLVKLNRVAAGAPVTLLGKVEGRNPSYSVKCRIGASMIWDAEESGILKPAWSWSSRPAATRVSPWPSWRRREATT